MKTNKLYFLLFTLLVLSQAIDAQDFSYYLQMAQERIIKEDCDGALMNYNLYKDLTRGKTSVQLEHQLGECFLSKEKPRHDFVDSIGNLSFTMVYVEGGTDTLGRTSSQDENDGETSKPHIVTLSGYYIGKYEVTFAEFELFIEETGYVTDAEKAGWADLWMKEDDKWDTYRIDGLNWRYGTDGKQRTFNEKNHPVLYVSWNDAVAYCEWLKSKTGKNYCLPTEAQWEFAARGGKQSKSFKFAGGNIVDNVGWCGSSVSSTHPKGLKTPNELGLFDMSGNAEEWCNDWYGVINEDFSFNPKGPLDGYSKVVRGGSWDRNAKCCQVSHRHHFSPSTKRGEIGFRIAISDLNGLDVNIGKTENQKQESNSSHSMTSDGDLTFTVNGVSFVMKPVEGGTFWMGAQHTNSSGRNYDREAFDDESPVHSVTLSNYYMGETEVTQALWKAVMGIEPTYETGWEQFGEKDDYPAYNVNWEECQEFIGKLNQLTEKNFRLPTEAEWEYAARGGKNSRGYKYAGSNCLDSVAWNWKNSGDKYLSGTDDSIDEKTIRLNNVRIHIVKSKIPNELGLYDMSGNVWEWCYDAKYNYNSSSQANPKHDGKSDSDRILRGGDYYGFRKSCRVSNRSFNYPKYKNYTPGFRLVLSE